MAKAQQSQKKATPTSSEKVSSGVRSVSRKITGAVRAERRANPPVADLIKRWEYRQGIIARDKDPRVAELRKRYLEEDRINARATELYEQFKSAGASFDACVFAVKTDWVSQFINKWGDKRRAAKEAENNTTIKTKLVEAKNKK